MNEFNRYAEKAKLNKYAEDAASSYLIDEVPLNDSIQKTAQVNNLAPEEINRVCEEANHKVYANLFNKLAEKTFEFDLADSRDIIGSLNKEASDRSSSAGARIAPGYRAVDVVDNSEIEKNASIDGLAVEGSDEFLGTKKQRCSQYLEKLSMIHANFKEAIGITEMKKEAATMDFYHDLKQMVLTGQASYHDIYSNLTDARPKYAHKIARMIKHAALQMGDKFEIAEFAKIAGVPVDNDLLSKGLTFSGRPLKVVNGRQTLVMSLDTLIKQDAEADILRKGLSITGDRVKALKKNLNNILSKEMSKDQ